jgi:tetratricopeptide (TPR) repeat protein
MTSNADKFAEAWGAQQAGDLPRAEGLYRELLQQDPANARAWYALGTVCHKQRQFDEAIAAFRRALAIRPDEAGGHFHLGNVLLEQHQWRAATAAYRQCLDLQPDHVGALANLGVALSEHGQEAEAVACWQQAIAIKPDCAEAHHNLGNLLRRQKKLEEAVGHFRAAVKAKPDYAGAHGNLGAALAALGRADEAIPFLEEALRLRPDHAETLNSLGATLSTLGRMPEAVALYDRAVALRPDYAEAHWNLALALLLQGDYQRGWPEYEWRWRWRRQVPSFPQPRWDGAPLNGQPILLYSEQGLGDTLQFIRYAALVKERGGTVVVQCQPALLPLLGRCPGIDQLSPAGGTLPGFVVQAPLMSLGGIFGTTLATIPARVPYLSADPDLVEHWRLQLAPVRGLRVGIAWQGSRTHAWDRHRSIPPEQFEALARVAGVRLVSLQKGDVVEGAAARARVSSVLSLGSRLDEDAGPFMDTAAIMQNLDLVITADTAVAHLAGALGVPVWVGLCAAPDWRWLLQGETSPWYPTMRLFRQWTPGDWEGVFARMADELRRLLADRRAAAPVLVEMSPGELLDRLAGLEVESERLTDPQQLARACQELARLRAARDRAVGRFEEVARLAVELREIHEGLRKAEDGLRLCEKEEDFGPRFIALARSVSRFNDRRGALRLLINEVLGARLADAKS